MHVVEYCKLLLLSACSFPVTRLCLLSANANWKGACARVTVCPAQNWVNNSCKWCCKSSSNPQREACNKPSTYEEELYQRVSARGGTFLSWAQSVHWKHDGHKLHSLGGEWSWQGWLWPVLVMLIRSPCFTNYIMLIWAWFLLSISVHPLLGA